MSSGNTSVTTQRNTVSLQDNNRQIVVTDNVRNKTVNVTQDVTNIVEVRHLGPQGAAATFIDIPDLTVSGGFVVSGSSIFSGSTTFEGDIIQTGSQYIDGNIYVEGVISASAFEGPGISATSGSVLIQELESNQNVGGVSSGDTFAVATPLEEVLRSILISDIPATLSSLGLTGVSDFSLEPGETISFDTITFNASADNPSGDFPTMTNFTIAGSDSSDGDIDISSTSVTTSNTVSVGTQNVDVATVTGNSSTVTFSVTGGSPMGPSLSTSISATYFYPMYYGFSENDLSAGGDLETPLTKTHTARGNKTLSISTPVVVDPHPGYYIYFAYPAQYGDLSLILDGNNFDVTGEFTKFVSNVTGGTWSGVSYNIYRAGLTGVNPAQNYKFNF